MLIPIILLLAGGGAAAAWLPLSDSSETEEREDPMKRNHQPPDLATSAEEASMRNHEPQDHLPEVVHHPDRAYPAAPITPTDIHLLELVSSVQLPGYMMQATPTGSVGLILDRWRMKHQVDHLKRQIERDGLLVQAIEARFRVITQLWASGMVSPAMRTFLADTYGGYFKRTQEAEEIADLQHQLRCKRLQAEMAKLQPPKPENSEEKYRKHYERTTKRILTDLREGYKMKQAIIQEAIGIKQEIERDASLTAVEREERITILMQDLHAALAKIHQESPYERSS